MQEKILIEILEKVIRIDERVKIVEKIMDRMIQKNEKVETKMNQELDGEYEILSKMKHETYPTRDTSDSTKLDILHIKHRLDIVETRLNMKDNVSE